MGLRARHGAAARGTRTGPIVEVAPIDELPAGVADPHTIAQPARNAAGHYVAGHPKTIAAAAAAGRARKHHTRLANHLSTSSADPEWRSYQRQAEAFRRAQCRTLAREIGGGVCGPAPASLVASAALALAGSRYAYDRGDLALGSRLAAESRQHLLGAHELCAREARARPAPTPSWMLPSTEQDAASDDADDTDPDAESPDSSDAVNSPPGAGAAR